MYKQMDIFDFIEKPTTCECCQPTTSMFERIFEKIDSPVIRCANCLCQYCANNAEEIWHRVRPEEMGEPCFNCDECYEYTGEDGHKVKVQRQCANFVISDYGVERNRKKIKIVKEL